MTIQYPSVFACTNIVEHNDSDGSICMQTRIELIRTAQAHFPERLALAVVCNPPFVFWALWRSVVPFLDPITK